MTVIVRATGNDYYYDTEVELTFTVRQKPVTLNWSEEEYTYDGYVHIPTAEIDASTFEFDDSGKVGVTVGGGQTEAGTHTARAVYLTGTAEDRETYKNYTVEGGHGISREFVINKALISVKLKVDETEQSILATYGEDKDRLLF